MAHSKQAWEQAGRDLGDLGDRVKQHYEQQTGAGRPGSADRRKMEDALRQLSDSLEQAFNALGEAVRDPEVAAQTKKAAASLGDAVASTFSELGERLRSTSGTEPRGPDTGTPDH
jgi:hypothetical protein